MVSFTLGQSVITAIKMAFFSALRPEVSIRTHRISATSKTLDMSDHPGLALIAGTLLSWARINNAEFMSYPDDTCNKEKISIACKDGKRSQPQSRNLSDCALIAVLQKFSVGLI
jgi:hypothetical protein